VLVPGGWGDPLTGGFCVTKKGKTVVGRKVYAQRKMRVASLPSSATPVPDDQKQLRKK
jgi:hypothetical protein